jgi:hypothetical protein
MIKRSFLLFLLQSFYFHYGKNKNLFKRVSLKHIKSKNKINSSKIFFYKFIKKRNFFYKLYVLKNPLFLFFFSFDFSLTNSLNFLLILKKYFILDIFNSFIAAIKNISLVSKIKYFLVKNLVIKKNKLILKLIYFFLLRNIKMIGKKELINAFLSFMKDKKALINSFKNLKKLLLTRQFNKLYFLSIFFKIERKYSFLLVKEKNLIYSKKKRYKFISFFL